MSHRGPDAALSADDAAGVGRKIVVWDVPTRVFHWLAVALIGAAYATARLNWMDWHARAGYALLVALLFRQPNGALRELSRLAARRGAASRPCAAPRARSPGWA
jgi:cytochrome b